MTGRIVHDSVMTDGASCFAPGLFEGRVALVTGGATGIGKEICRIFGAHGARIVMASRKQDTSMPRSVSFVRKASTPRSVSVTSATPKQCGTSSSRWSPTRVGLTSW